MAFLCFHIIATTLLSDLCLFPILLCASSVRSAAFISLCDFALGRRALCLVTSGARLWRAQQRLKGALVLDDKGIANMTSGEPVGQLRQLQTRLQWPDGIISENRQSVDAVAEASVQRSGAGPLLRVQAGARVTAPAVRPRPRRILLGVPSVPKR